MNQAAKKHLSRAVEVYKVGHREAAKEIVAARKADIQLTWDEIGQAFDKSGSWARKLVNWYEAGARGPINWERGSHSTNGEKEAAVTKFLKEATPKELAKVIPPKKVAGIVATSSQAAHAIADNEKASLQVGMANAARFAGTSGGGGGGGKKLFKNNVLTKIELLCARSHNIAMQIALTWKDDAPTTDDEKTLRMARDAMAEAIQDFESIITKAIRETRTKESVHGSK